MRDSGVTSIAQTKDQPQQLAWRLVLESNKRLTPDELRYWLFRYEFAQHPDEFNWLLERMNGSKSVLEIGSRFGSTLLSMAKKLKPPVKFVAVDLPNADDNVLDSERTLRLRCDQIIEMGHTCTIVFGDSHDSRVIEQVKALGPYDFCFIDGDHSESGVRQDWEHYGQMATTVAFHDIGVPAPCYVYPLWSELRGTHRTTEFQSNNEWIGMGIGIVHKELHAEG